MARQVRRIIKIDEDRCNGCGKCVSACVEGAIQLVDGKARLVSESYCDGLGACIGECPQGAITIEEREAEEFDAQSALAHASLERRSSEFSHTEKTETEMTHVHADGTVCPSARSIDRRGKRACPTRGSDSHDEAPSELVNWPVKLRLVNPGASFFQGAELLLAADCTAFAYGGFHTNLLRDKVLIVFCPKFDDLELHAAKLREILRTNTIRAITVAKMEVPCCSGIVRLAQAAIEASGKQIPLNTVTVSLSGELLVQGSPCCPGSRTS